MNFGVCSAGFEKLKEFLTVCTLTAAQHLVASLQLLFHLSKSKHLKTNEEKKNNKRRKILRRNGKTKKEEKKRNHCGM